MSKFEGLGVSITDYLSKGELKPPTVPDVKKEVFNFYTDDFKIKPSRLAEYFTQNGFIRISEEGNDNILIIKNENKILKPFNYKTDTTSFLRIE